jgi:hypothetical protein
VSGDSDVAIALDGRFASHVSQPLRIVTNTKPGPDMRPNLTNFTEGVLLVPRTQSIKLIQKNLLNHNRGAFAFLSDVRRGHPIPGTSDGS